MSNSLIAFILKMNIIRLLFSGSERTASIKKNIIVCFILKGISILASMAIIPLTLNYVDKTEYGIWLTISSIIAWLTYFDIGFTNGFRNKFAECIARGETLKAKEYVSTTYISLAILFIFFAIIFILMNNKIGWSSFLNVDAQYEETIRKAMFFLIVFFCITFVARVFTTMLTALQMPALSSGVDTLGQIGALIGIICLTRFTDGDISSLVFVFSGIPCIVLLLISIISFSTKFKKYSPSIICVRFDYVKDIMKLGVQLFVISISMLVIFQLINIIISRYVDIKEVTDYNISYKYYNMLSMVVLIIITPFWSAFTDAYSKNDITWMNNAFIKINRLGYLVSGILLIMIFFSNLFFSVWIGEKVSISWSLSISVALLVLAQSLGQIYMNLVNGLSKFRLQMCIYVLSSIICIPLMILLGQRYGTPGVLLIPSSVYFAQAFFAKKQIVKVIEGKASGIWNK